MLLISTDATLVSIHREYIAHGFGITSPIEDWMLTSLLTTG